MTDWLDRTHVGDCRQLMLQMIADGVRVNCVVTSPPYWNLRNYNVPGQLGLERSWIRYLARMRTVFRIARQLLTDDGTLWLNMGDSYASNGGPGWQGKNGQRADRRFTLTRNQVAFRDCRRSARNGLKPKDMVGMPWRVALALQADGWWLRSDIIWHKENAMPESVTDRPTKAHEYVLLLSKCERYYYDAEAIREPTTGNSHSRGTAVNPKATAAQGIRSKQNASFSAAITQPVPDRNVRTVWTIPSEPFSGAHFATFPQALVARCILAGSRPGDIIFDPFMGSGTVAQVATDLGRHFIGCELNGEYIALAEQYRKTTIGMPI